RVRNRSASGRSVEALRGQFMTPTSKLRVGHMRRFGLHLSSSTELCHRMMRRRHCEEMPWLQTNRRPSSLLLALPFDVFPHQALLLGQITRCRAASLRANHRIVYAVSLGRGRPLHFLARPFYELLDEALLLGRIARRSAPRLRTRLDDVDTG